MPVIWLLLSPAFAGIAPCPSVWPANGATDVPTDTLLMALCSENGEPASFGLTGDGQTRSFPVTTYVDPGGLEPDTEYTLGLGGRQGDWTFTTGSDVAQPVTDAPRLTNVQLQQFGGGLVQPSMHLLIRHDAPAEHAAAMCIYEATTHTRLACRAADGLALAFEDVLGSFPPEEACFEGAWHNARGEEGPSSEPVCVPLTPPIPPEEPETCNTAGSGGTWVWLGLLALLRRRRR